MSEYKRVKLGDICKIVKDSTGIASAEPGEYPLVVTAVERKTCSTYQFDCEAVCIPLVSSSGHGKKSLNNVRLHKHASNVMNVFVDKYIERGNENIKYMKEFTVVFFERFENTIRNCKYIW